MLTAFFPRIAMLATVAFALMQVGSLKAQQAPEPVPVPPASNVPSLGIVAEAFSTNTPLGRIEGVRVIRDYKRRPLHKANANGGWQKFKFRPKYDVILEVNGTSVYTVDDVRCNTQLKWNCLRIWDRKTGTTADYKIYLN